MTDTTTLAPTDAELHELADRCTPNTETGSLNYRDYARAVLAKWGAPQPAAPQGDVAAWLVLADGEPHHVTPGASDGAARLWAEEQTKCGAPYSFTFLPLCPPAAIDAAMAAKETK